MALTPKQQAFIADVILPSMPIPIGLVIALIIAIVTGLV